MANKQGSILFIAVGIILVVSVLAAAILRIISNQSRLTHHQVSRIQSIYAAKAAIVYTMDKLRRNDDATWPANVEFRKIMCRTNPCQPSGSTPNIIEADLPSQVQQVDITVRSPNTGIAGTREITATATYTYP